MSEEQVEPVTPLPDVPVIPDDDPDEPSTGDAEDDGQVSADPLEGQGDNDPQDDVPLGSIPDEVV